MRVLVIAAHPDDEILGCGGTIKRYQDNGDDVRVLLLGKGRGTENDNMFDTKPFITWVQKIEKEIRSAETVFTHYRNDLNIDHRITFKAVVTAARPGITSVKQIYSFEIPSSTDFNPTACFTPALFVEIDIDNKTETMKKKYPQELRDWPHPRSPEGIRALATYRGMQSGLKCAEAFEIVRSVW